jgi:hypothetical protein
MKQFFKDLMSGSSETSSKRFAALFTLANLIILAYVAAYNSPNKILPEFMWAGLIILVGGGLGLTVVEKIFGGKAKDKDKDDTTPSA